MKLSVCLHQFFDRYLTSLKGVSINTIKAYRDTFTHFLPFAAKYYSIKVDSLMLHHLSTDVIIDFLEHLEVNHHNSPQTRNFRLTTLKSFAKMLQLLHPEYKQIAQMITNLPKKNALKPLVGYLNHDEAVKIFNAVDLNKNEGFRDYTILNLLYDSGARASEISNIKISDFDVEKRNLAILGKGNRYRIMKIFPRTLSLIKKYIEKYRINPLPFHKNILFINQRRQGFTRHGIYRLCKKYQSLVLDSKRVSELNPVHSFRHGCAVNMLLQGKDVTEIKNRLGHANVETTMTYLKMDIVHKKEIQKEFVEFTKSVLSDDSQISELIDWENKEATLAWLDSL